MFDKAARMRIAIDPISLDQPDAQSWGLTESMNAVAIYRNDGSMHLQKTPDRPGGSNSYEV